MNIFEHLKQVKVFPLQLFGIDVSITNGVLVMFLAAALVVFFFSAVSRKSRLVPFPLQSLAEYMIEFIKTEMLAPLGKEGEAWLPFMVAIFSFILACNLLGIIPGLLPPTSNINITATMAVMVFLTTQIVGIKKHGVLGYLKSIVPAGLPLPVVAFILPVEIVGQFARPFSLAVRLFANMFAGHAIILILISLIFVFKSFYIIPLPVLGTVAILAFEIFISFIQAFIFTYLSASYIVGALQTEH
jgi:F-type H+-transporting ATPase subunit a